MISRLRLLVNGPLLALTLALCISFLAGPQAALAALDFDGVNDEVNHGDLGNRFDNATALTWMVWLYWDIIAAGGDGFLGKDALIPGYSPAGTPTQMAAGQAGVWEKTTTDGGLSTGVWIHWAWRYDGSLAADDRLLIYRNGVPQTMAGTNPGITIGDFGAVGFRVGVNAVIGSFVDCKIAHLRVWDAALTPAQIAQEVDSYRPVNRTENLILWAPYDEATPSARDYSGRDNHGTVTGGPVYTPGPPISYGGD